MFEAVLCRMRRRESSPASRCCGGGAPGGARRRYDVRVCTSIDHSDRLHSGYTFRTRRASCERSEQRAGLGGLSTSQAPTRLAGGFEEDVDGLQLHIGRFGSRGLARYDTRRRSLMRATERRLQEVATKVRPHPDPRPLAPSTRCGATCASPLASRSLRSPASGGRAVDHGTASEGGLPTALPPLETYALKPRRPRDGRSAKA